MNIHIGCEHKIGESWENFDVSFVAVYEKIPFFGKLISINSKRYPKKVKFGDITKKTLCDYNMAENIYCSHTLEHMSLEGMKRALNNIYKMLKPNGCFRLIVPNLKRRVEEYMKNQNADLLIEHLGLGQKYENNDLISKLRNLFGNSRHKWMYDEMSMRNYLLETGFKNLRKCSYGDSGIEVFSELEEKHRFVDGDFTEVAIQCTK